MLLVPNSNGFKDFCVKSLKGAAVGRKEIKIAEQGELLSLLELHVDDVIMTRTILLRMEQW